MVWNPASCPGVPLGLWRLAEQAALEKPGVTRPGWRGSVFVYGAFSTSVPESLWGHPARWLPLEPLMGTCLRYASQRAHSVPASHSQLAPEAGEGSMGILGSRLRIPPHSLHSLSSTPSSLEAQLIHSQEQVRLQSSATNFNRVIRIKVIESFFTFCTNLS